VDYRPIEQNVLLLCRSSNRSNRAAGSCLLVACCCSANTFSQMAQMYAVGPVHAVSFAQPVQHGPPQQYAVPVAAAAAVHEYPVPVRASVDNRPAAPGQQQRTSQVVHCLHVDHYLRLFTRYLQADMSGASNNQLPFEAVGGAKSHVMWDG
jgi:hypothetical protein